MPRTDVYVVYVDTAYLEHVAHAPIEYSERPTRRAAGQRAQLALLLDQLHPLDAARMRDRLAGLSQRDIARKYGVSDMAVTYSLRRAFVQLQLHSKLPVVTEQQFHDQMTVFVQDARKLRALYAYWQTTSITRSAHIAECEQKFVRKCLNELIDLLSAASADTWLAAWIILRDNKGLRNKDKNAGNFRGNRFDTVSCAGAHTCSTKACGANCKQVR